MVSPEGIGLVQSSAKREDAGLMPEGIDHGKARPKADAVWLMPSGVPNSRRMSRIVLRFAAAPLAARPLTQDIRPVACHESFGSLRALRMNESIACHERAKRVEW